MGYLLMGKEQILHDLLDLKVLSPILELAQERTWGRMCPVLPPILFPSLPVKPPLTNVMTGASSH